MLDVKHLHGHLNVSLLVRSYRGARVANASFHIGNCASDAGNHAGAVFRYGQQLDRVSRLFRSSGPFDFNDPFPINHERGYVLTTLLMNGHTLSPGDITNNLFAVKRIAAAGACDHQIVNAAHHD